jgi:hypothetical protein
MKNNLKYSAIAIAIATSTMLALPANATESVRINGFANLVGGMTSSDDNLYGYNDRVSFSEESLFAIQISADINDKMTATGQLVARGRDDYEAGFDWAYITYQATDTISISAGRFRLPLFNYSTSSEVGYSYHWVTTPRVVYDVAFNNLEGVKFDYVNYTGDWEYNLSASLGTFNDDSTGVPSRGENTVLLSAEATYDWFKVRGVAGATKSTLDLTASTDEGTRAFGLGLESMSALGLTTLADSLAIEDDTGEFVGVTIQIDKFDWFISGEYTKVTVSESFASPDEVYYVTAGIRSGRWTPSVTYENSQSDSEVKFLDQINAIQGTALPDAAKLAFTQLAIGGQLAQETDYEVLTASVRYDLESNVALKADVSRYENNIDDASNATLVRFAVNYVF